LPPPLWAEIAHAPLLLLPRPLLLLMKMMIPLPPRLSFRP